MDDAKGCIIEVPWHDLVSSLITLILRRFGMLAKFAVSATASSSRIDRVG